MKSTLALMLGLLTVALPTSVRAEETTRADYFRHVQAVFSRLGCNNGGCHGAVQGKNGFRLSLFGADPATDHTHLLRREGGRRLDLGNPANSLLLLKATGRLPHLGGVRTSPGSPEYGILLRWLQAGAPPGDENAGRLVDLTVTPTGQTLQAGETKRLRVDATFGNGTTEDVTALCVYESLDTNVLTVTGDGTVAAVGTGDAALLVRYRDRPALARILVPRTGPGVFPDVKPVNFIDRQVLDKLRKLNLPPAEPADDPTFLRRATLDVTGALPTADEVRTFLESRAADKRERVIDDLLTRPGHAALWTLRFCDLLKAGDWGEFGSAFAVEKDAPRFQAWVRARLDENLPYDEFAARILLATSREGRTLEEYGREVVALQEGYAPGRKDLDLYAKRRTPDLYWQRNGSSGIAGAIQIAHSFLGLRLECAQCHRHPSDVWQQDDLLSFANLFQRVRPAGVQSDNSKKYPELAAVAKTFEEEGKKLSARIKELREGEGKKLDAAAKEARAEIEKINKGTGPRDRLPALKEIVEQADRFAKEVSALQKRADLMPTVGNRLLNGEIHILASAKPASVTSPLGTQTSKESRLLGEKAPVTADDRDPREAVVAWMRRPENPYFARALVNRVWAHYFGRGIVDPPDNLSPYNPATHPELLTELSNGFVKNRFDLRWLHRTILLSRTYQQSHKARAESAGERSNYASFYLRRLPAEVVVDALSQAIGVPIPMGMEQLHWPADVKAVEAPFPPKDPFVAYLLSSFGKSGRNTSVQCDCQRESSISTSQALSLANHPRVWALLADPKGRAAKLVRDEPEDERRIEALYLSTLSRLPLPAERDSCRAFLKESADSVTGLRGILWSLLNTREFLLQH